MTGDRPIAEDDLHAYIDDALEPKRRDAVEAYLATNPEVAQRIRRYAEQRVALRAALAPVAAEPLPPHLNLVRLIEGRRRQRSAPWRMAAAAVVLLALGATGGWMTRGAVTAPATGIAALAQEAADSYAVYGPDRIQPVEMRAENSDRLIAWISERLNRRIAVPDLSASGYRFMGGRLVATSHGAAGLLMYDDDHGNRLVMLMRPMESDRNAPMSERVAVGVTAFTWAENGFGYSLAGPATPEVLHPLADEARRQLRT